jgi:hypothetical protein
MKDSAGCIIVAIGLPDPKAYIVLKPQPELHPYMYAGPGQHGLFSGAYNSAFGSAMLFVQLR